MEIAAIKIATDHVLANAACLSLIAKHLDGEVHMRALLIFPKDDVIANVAVILSGVLFGVLDSRYLDLVIVFVIAVV